MPNPKRSRLQQRVRKIPSAAAQDYLGMVNDPEHLNLYSGVGTDTGDTPPAGGGSSVDTGDTGGGSGIPPSGTGGGAAPPAGTGACTDNAEITQITNGVNPQNARLQSFRIGPCVLDGYTYTLEVYSHPVSVTAQSDNPITIASKLAAAINATSPADWNAYPTIQTQTGFPPHAFSNGDVVNVSLNAANQFAAYASGTPPVTPPPPPPPGPVYPAPADTGTIDGWDCPTLSSKKNEYNNVLADPALDQPTRTAYENALLEINSRYTASCEPAPPNVLDNPLGDKAPILPSPQDIDGMDCAALKQQVVSLTTNAPLYRNSATDLQNWQNTLDYVNKAVATRCVTATPTPSASSPTPPQINILPGNAAPMGGGGGGSSQQQSPAASPVKTWWWLGLIAVGAAFLLYKPGMKPGVVK